MSTWEARVERIGLTGVTAAAVARQFAELATRTHAGGSAEVRAWWVPGRIEVLGKHTDYGGGRSLLCAVERGFHVLAAPCDDAAIHIRDHSTDASVSIPFSADAEPRPGYWTDYPITVVRRIARDFPGADRGVNMLVRSSLPSASGLSSSSALVIAAFLPIAAFNNLEARPEWQRAITTDDLLAEYLGAMENGRAFGPFPADRGVGTHGGSEDQTAILRARPNHLLQYHFMPVTHEATIPLPDGWCFVIAMSGVHAAKGGAAQARYNALATETRQLVDLWNRERRQTQTSLFAILRSSTSAGDELDAMLANAGDDAPRRRLDQFRIECETIIPAVALALDRGDVRDIGDLVARSQTLAETVLQNQVPETVHLAHRARLLGAAAASAFGAGFGGSVWALVSVTEAIGFRARWRSDYLARFPERRVRAEFFTTGAAPPAQEL